MKNIIFFLITLNILFGLLEAKRIRLYVPNNENVEEFAPFDVVLPNKNILQIDMYVRLIEKNNFNATKPINLDKNKKLKQLRTNCKKKH